MKHLVRFLILVAAGLLLGLILPMGGGEYLELFAVLETLVLNLAAWVVLPLLFLQTAMNTYELRLHPDRNLLARTIGILLATTVMAVVLGILIVFIFNPERLVPINNGGQNTGKFSFETLVNHTVPASIFSLFNGNQLVLPGLFLAASLGGWALFELRSSVKTALELGNNLYRLVVRINSYIGMVVASLVFIPVVSRILLLRDSQEITSFQNILFIVLVPVVVLSLVVYPLILYFTKRIPIPRYFRFIVQPFILGMASGNNLASYGLLNQAAQSERLTRPGEQWFLSLLGIFSRPGTAMISAMSFILVIRSYTSLEIAPYDIFFAIMIITGCSLLLSAFSGAGIMVILSLVSGLYGRGMGESYFIIQGALPLLVAAGVALDTATNAFLMLQIRFADSVGARVDDRDGSKILDDFQM